MQAVRSTQNVDESCQGVAGAATKTVVADTDSDTPLEDERATLLNLVFTQRAW